MRQNSRFLKTGRPEDRTLRSSSQNGDIGRITSKVQQTEDRAYYIRFHGVELRALFARAERKHGF